MAKRIRVNGVLYEAVSESGASPKSWTLDGSNEKIIAKGNSNKIVRYRKKNGSYYGTYAALIPESEQDVREGNRFVEVQVTAHDFMDYTDADGNPVRGRPIGSHYAGTSHTEWLVFVRNWDTQREGRGAYSELDGFTKRDVENFVNSYIKRMVKADLLDANEETVRQWCRRSALRIANGCFPGGLENRRLYYNPNRNDPYWED